MIAKCFIVIITAHFLYSMHIYNNNINIYRARIVNIRSLVRGAQTGAKNYF